MPNASKEFVIYIPLVLEISVLFFVTFTRLVEFYVERHNALCLYKNRILKCDGYISGIFKKGSNFIFCQPHFFTNNPSEILFFLLFCAILCVLC
jgi:hypothetical protein